MLEAYGNIWDLAPEYDTVVITTNGYVKKNGEAVLGRGIAKEAKEIFPDLPLKLGKRITEHGNLCFGFSVNSDFSDYPFIGYDTVLTGPIGWKPQIYCLPVKPQFGPNGEMGWKAKAEIPLIQESIKALIKSVNYHQSHILGDGWLDLQHGRQARVVMPRPGCGNGGLKWEQVRPAIEPLLDDRFTVVTFQP